MTITTAQTVAEAIRAATELLGPRTDSARLDAELLMAHALNASRSELFLRRMGDPAPPGFASLVERRAACEPVAYILGEAYFWGLRFKVNPAVLVPRADSETMLEAARAALVRRPPRRILDLGTGSGCLLLAALHEWPDAQGVGIDCSSEALSVARDNAQALGLAERTQLIEADWTAHGWAECLGRFDLILANPPYVENDAALDSTVRDFEPAVALFAGPEGLDAYRVLVPQMHDLLAPDGVALVEIGHSQTVAVSAIAACAGLEATLHHDLGERPRVLQLQIPLGNLPASA